MSFAVAKTIATARVSSKLDYCNSFYHNISLNDILKLQPVQNCLARVITHSSCFSHSAPFLYCIGSLSNIALFLRSVQLPIKYFHPSNQHIFIHCSLLQDSPDSFDHLILIYFMFLVLIQMSEIELFRLLPRLCGTHSLLVLSL